MLILGLCGLLQAQTFTSISPNGGNLVQGAAYSIQWTYSGIPDSTLVKLVLFKDGTKLGNIVENISIGGGGAGARAWTVGNWEGGGPAAEGGGYRIRIRDMDGKYPYLDSVPPFSITVMKKVNVRPGMSDRPPFLLKLPKLEVTGVDLVPYPDGTVNVTFAYRNTGTAPLPRRSEFAVQPDFRVVVDGRELAKGDLFIPENPPAPPGWEVATHFGGSLKFPTESFPFTWCIGNTIYVHINERKAGGMEASFLTENLKKMALKFGYDLLVNGMDFDWSTNTLKLWIRLDGVWDHGQKFYLMISPSPGTPFSTRIQANQPSYIFTHKFDVWARTSKISFDVSVSGFEIGGVRPILDVDTRNNCMIKEFIRPK
jgi:hypothetical protein